MSEEIRSASLVIRLFGAFDARIQDLPLPRFRRRKSSWLLAWLALRPAGVDRAWLAATLWPDATESLGLQYLRRELADLRRALGAEARRLGSPTPRALSLDLTGAWVDVVLFDAAIARGARDPLLGDSALEAAVALYRGPLLPDCLETWAIEERQVREQAYLNALEALARRAMAQGDPTTAEQYLRRAVTADPLRESAQRALMQALAAGGNTSAALRVYRDLGLLLHREVDVEPDPETRALSLQIKDQVSHRHAGISDDVPRSASDASVVAGEREVWLRNLPCPLTRFIGREAEIADLRRLLTTTRLLTLTGAGGCGKSRLALEIARAGCDNVPDGIWLVELASLADPILLPQSVAKVLDVPERPGESLTDTLVRVLKPRRMLLLLDNCEHLLAGCVVLVEALLRGCAGLRVLATSREALGILGETTYRVPGLSLPALDGSLCQQPTSLLESEAVRLFVDRAAAVEPSFALTAQNGGAVERICRQLDGLPLALEMGAALVRAMPVEALADRIGDRFRLLTDGNRAALPRHRTLRAMIQWSYDLLPEPEKILLHRLSVFAGGWTLEAAESVCSTCGREAKRQKAKGQSDKETSQLLPFAFRPLLFAFAPGDVLDLLTKLADKSLVVYENRGGDGRYSLLETIRQFAQEYLVASSEVEAARQRHVEYYLRWAETLEPHLSSTSPLPWLDRLERELDNLRAVLTWAIERPNPVPEGEATEVGLRLAAGMRIFWQVRGYATEGRGWLAKLLAFTETEGHMKVEVPVAVRAKALHVAGWLAWPQGDGATARALLQQSLALAREQGDRWLAAYSLNSLGAASAPMGEYTAARAHLEESLSLFRELGDRRMVAMLCNNLGALACEQGDFATATSLAEESIRIRCELGDRAATRLPLIGLGSVRMLQSDYPGALAYYEESLAISRQLGDLRPTAIALCHLGALAHYQGDVETARARYGESLRLHQQMGNQGELMACLVGLGCVDVVTGENGRRAHTRAEAWFARGARLFGAAERLREVTGWQVPFILRDQYERCVAVAREALGEGGEATPPRALTGEGFTPSARGPGAFAAAWAAGRALSLDQTCADALEDESGDSTQEKS